MTDTEHGFEPKCSCKCGHVAMGPWHSPGRCEMYVGALDRPVADTEKPTYDELAAAVLAASDCCCESPRHDDDGNLFMPKGGYPTAWDCPHLEAILDLAERLRGSEQTNEHGTGTADTSAALSARRAQLPAHRSVHRHAIHHIERMGRAARRAGDVRERGTILHRMDGEAMSNHEYPLAAALADWIVEVRWALEACHEHVGLDGLKRLVEKEAVLLVMIDKKEHR